MLSMLSFPDESTYYSFYLDTSAVGVGVMPVILASLGPASIICDYVYYINTWIGVATTNLHAAAVADKDSRASRDLVKNGTHCTAN